MKNSVKCPDGSFWIFFWAFDLIDIIIHSNGSELANFTELFNSQAPCLWADSNFLILSSLVAIKPDDENSSKKPSRLSKAEQEQFFLPDELKPFAPHDNKKSRLLTKEEKSQFTLSVELKQILVGLIIGDLFIQKQTLNRNPILFFEQGLVHSDYLFHLYELFNSYCSSAPKTNNRLPDRRTGKIYSSIYFRTYSLPCFNELYHLFYTAEGKRVPANIGELLTPLSLAYWLCDDGSFCKTSRRVTLNTQGFTLEEVNLLAKTLDDKWSLKYAVYKNRNGFVIRIPKKSLPVLQALLKDILPTMMRYKIGL